MIALCLSGRACQQIGKFNELPVLAVDVASTPFADPLSEVMIIVRRVGTPR